MLIELCISLHEGLVFSFNVIRYELSTIDGSNIDTVVEFYRRIVGVYVNKDKELFDHFNKLTDEQLRTIKLRRTSRHVEGRMDKVLITIRNSYGPTIYRRTDINGTVMYKRCLSHVPIVEDSDDDVDSEMW